MTPSEPARDDGHELALLDAWRHGDSAAIATLLRGYQARIYAVCFRMLHSVEEAGDLTQDTLVKVLDGLHTYDRRSQLSTWIIRVAMNCCLSHMRKQKLRRHASIEDFGSRSGAWGSIGATLQSAAVSEPGGSAGVERNERRAAVLRALARLDPETQAILVLRDTQDFEYQQIGEVLGVPVGTVKSRLFRARAALREATLAELGPSELGPSELGTSQLGPSELGPAAKPDGEPAGGGAGRRAEGDSASTASARPSRGTAQRLPRRAER